MAEKNLNIAKKRWPSRSDAFFVGFVLLSGVAGVGAIKIGGNRTSLPVEKADSQPTASPKKSSSEAVTFSSLAGVSLPQGARLIREEAAVTDSAHKLQARAAQLSPDLQMEKLEVLIWPYPPQGNSSAASQAITVEVQKRLQKAGYLFQYTSSSNTQNNTVREFLAVSRATKRITPGFWMETKEFLLLGWASFKPRDAGKAQKMR